MKTPRNEFDYIIIGSGSAGSALAYQLLNQEKSSSILILEAGNSNTLSHVRNFRESIALRGTSYDWRYQSLPQKGLNNRTLQYNAGKILGGTSSINGMVWAFGHKQDYLHWEQDEKSLLAENARAIFKSMECFEEGDLAYRGKEGPISVTTKWSKNGITEDFIESMQSMRLLFNEDYNGAYPYGIGYTQLNVDKEGFRQDSFTCLLSSFSKEKNLCIKSESHATKILFDRDLSAIGVEFINRGNSSHAYSKQEIIICAGIVGTPTLLFNSGIGDENYLYSLGIKPIINLPGVGENFQDHPISFVVRSLNRLDPLLENVMNATLFLDEEGNTTPSLKAPSFQIQTYTMSKNPLFPANSFVLGITALQPISKGAVKLNLNNKGVNLDPKFFLHEEDITKQLKSIKIARKLMNFFANQYDWLGDEIYPGKNCISDAELIDYIRNTTTSNFHGVGSCKISSAHDPYGVVDFKLRVRGIKNLRIADASAIPVITSANTNVAATIMGVLCAQYLNGSKRNLLADTLSLPTVLNY